MNIVKNKYGEIRSWISIATMVAMVVVMYVVMLLSTTIAGAQFRSLGAELAPYISLIIITVIYVVFCLVTALSFRLFYRRSRREMGLPKSGAVPHTILGLVFGAVSIAAVAGILVLSGQASVTEIEPARILTLRFWASLWSSVLVGVFEELLYRGYMMTALKTSRNKLIIMLLPALIFSMMHIFNSNVTFFSLLNLVLFGILEAYLMVKTGDIWASIGWHITWNFVQVSVLGISVSGGAPHPGVLSIAVSGNWFTGGAFGAEGGAACTLVLILGLLFIRFCVKSPAERAWTFENGLPMPIGKGMEDKERK